MIKKLNEIKLAAVKLFVGLAAITAMIMTMVAPTLRADGQCGRVGSACDVNRKCHASIFDTDNDPGCTCDVNNICANATC